MTGLEDRGLTFRFKNAVFIVLENIFASGHGLFIPETDGHIVLSSVLMILGRFILCYILSEASFIIFTRCLQHHQISRQEIKFIYCASFSYILSY